MNFGYDFTETVPAIIVAYFYGIIISFIIGLIRYLIINTFENRERR